MKVERIDVYIIRFDQHYKVAGHAESPGRLPGTDYYIEPHWTHAYSRVVEAGVVRITASDGAVGWGEVQAPLTPQTATALITTLLGPALLGQPALATSALFDRMYQLMLARGHTGSFLVDAMAGLDIALWDLKGRHYGAPIAQLLGGPYRHALPAYVTGLRVPGLPEKLELAKSFRQRGFAGIKLLTGASVRILQDEARAVRAAIGDDAFLGVDAICKYDLAAAMQVGRTLDEVGADWFEAPLHAEDIAGHATLARTVSTRIAVGETLRTPRQFEPWLRERALAVAQPDIMRTGITGAVRIAALAETHHVPVTLHTGICTGIGMAATWQVAAALPGSLPQEHQHDLFARVNGVLETPLQEQGGRLLVPDRPGIGAQVDEEAVARSAIEHWVVDTSGRRLVSR
jgi:L-alanine-DL-glutamate epimerase-like enolase superfamily enzyme